MGESGGVAGLVGRRLPGHFVGEVVAEAARALGAGAEIRVRLPNGELDEALLCSSARTTVRSDHGPPPQEVR